MREQIRLWFYSQLFMSVVLVGRAPFQRVLGYEKMLDEHGREMHGSWGNMIDAEDAFERMGADVMRWQYCAQPPDRNLLFGFGPAHEIKRKLLTFWNSAKFLVDYANIEGFEPTLADLETGPPAERPLDRWLVARTHELVREATEAYEATLTVNVIRAFEAFVDDLSNWYIRRSRRRFYSDDDAAFRTLWYALVQSLRVIAPVMPFLADHLWRNLVAGRAGVGLPRRLAGGAEPDRALLAEIAEVRRVVELGRQARSTSGLKLRQPLRRLVVAGGPRAQAHADEIADELNVKEVEFGDVEASGAAREAEPAGARAQARRGAPRGARGARRGPLRGARRRPLPGRRPRARARGGARRARRPRGLGASRPRTAITVALDTTLDDELRLEGRLNDLIRDVQVLRKDSGLEIIDRIRLWIPDEELLPFADRIAGGDARRLGRARRRAAAREELGDQRPSAIEITLSKSATGTAGDAGQRTEPFTILQFTGPMSEEPTKRCRPTSFGRFDGGKRPTDFVSRLP